MFQVVYSLITKNTAVRAISEFLAEMNAMHRLEFINLSKNQTREMVLTMSNQVNSTYIETLRLYPGPVSILFDARGTLNQIEALVIYIKFTQHSLTHQFLYRLV